MSRNRNGERIAAWLVIGVLLLMAILACAAGMLAMRNGG